MKYTQGKDRRQGSHLTDLIGHGPMRIVFTLFFLFLLGSQYPVSPGPMVRMLSLLFISIGLPVPRFSGPDGSAAEPGFLFLLGSQYPHFSGPDCSAAHPALLKIV